MVSSPAPKGSGTSLVLFIFFFWLSLILATADALFTDLDCPSVDNDGNTLAVAASRPDLDDDVECIFNPNSNVCLYSNSEGSLTGNGNADSCPQNLLQGQASGSSVALQSTHPASPSSSSTRKAPIQTNTGAPQPGSATTKETTPSSTFSGTALSQSPSSKLMPPLATSTSNHSTSAPFIKASANSSSGSVTPAATSSISDLGNGRKGPRVPAAAIAGPIAAMILVVLVFILLLRRRKRQWRQMRPQIYSTVEPHITPEKAAPASDFTSTDSAVAGPGTSPVEGVSPVAIPDAITRRMHELEAQIETLLMHGQPDDSPPEYASV